MEVNNVQLIGGHADGMELSIIDLPEYLQFKCMDGARFAYGDWNQTEEVFHIETYVNLPGTTVYVLKRIE